MIKNYKYDMMSTIILVITLVALAIFALVFSDFGTNLGSELRDSAETGTSVSSENINISTNFLEKDTTKYSDNYVFWFFVAGFIGLILTAMYLDFEPSVMIIIFIFGTIAVLGAWLGTEINSDFATDDNLASTASQMTKTQLIMSNPYFPVFIFVGLIVMIVIMYNKKRTGEYQ